MIDWQERLARESPPGIRVEHESRYRLAAPLILDSATWCDLGCGNGLAGAGVLAGAVSPRVVLVDRDEAAARAAAGELGAGAIAIAADLTSVDDVARVREALLDGPHGPRIVTAFEIVERLATFLPLVETLAELAGEVDVVLSVPNDAFWAIKDPEHQTMWSEGAFEELRRLLPAETVVLRQVALSGSVVIPLDSQGAGRAELDTRVTVDAGAAVPTHMLAAFGPRAGRLVTTAAVAPVDLDGQRRWEREREAAAAMVDTLTAANAGQAAALRRHMGWTAYINGLERRLGLPLSAAGEGEPPPGDHAA